jgi:sensor domain CHASE-containing protein
MAVVEVVATIVPHLVGQTAAQEAVATEILLEERQHRDKETMEAQAVVVEQTIQVAAEALDRRVQTVLGHQTLEMVVMV